jgi:diguanylate cyclase (GGDEF)-like protein
MTNPPVPAEVNRSPRILVIDDDPQTTQIVRTWFARDPYEILSAEDGENGLRLARSESPDLILLDLRMPGIDGFAVARQLKSDPKTQATPVIVLTACRDVDAKVEAFAAGTDDYVTKPFQFEEVDARIRSMLRRREMLVGLESTIRELSDNNEQLEQLLMVDEKTGLYNFREFRRRLLQEWSRALRYGTSLALVFLDIDDFKKLNDTLGHLAGDRVLAEFATLVTGGARANDVAARYGGEEFSVILPHTDVEMALRVAERIRRAVREFVFLEEDEPVHITVSAGVATYPSETGIDSVDDLVRAADLALYQAKDQGKDCVVRAERIHTEGTVSKPADLPTRRSPGKPVER